MSNGQKSLVGTILLGVVLAGCLVFGYKAYNDHQEKVRYEAYQRREAERIAAEKAETERVAAEKARAEAQERLKVELERQREEEKRERIEQERKAAEEAAERQRKIDELKANMAEYQAAITSFKNREYGFAEQAPAEAKVSTAAEGVVFWCAMSDFRQTKELLKLTADGKGGFVAQRFAQNESPVEMNSAEVKRLIDSGGCAMVVLNKVWVTVPGGRRGTCLVPEAGEKLVPSKVDIKEMSETLEQLGCEPPNVRCKVVLRSNEGKFIQEVGVYPYAAEIDLSKMRRAVRRTLENNSRRKNENACDTEKPRKSEKRRKYRKTVILYDGQIIRKEMKGITYVPREFHYTGSNRYGTNNDKYYAAERQWRNLYDEALRQEKLEREMLAGNSETTSPSRSSTERTNFVSYDDVEDFLAKCKLQVLLARPKEK